MATARFRFADTLSPFLCREHRDGEFAHECARAATLKNAIEALGVPHTEIGAVLVNGEPATLQRIVLTRDRELLKCREVARGCYVRSLRVEDQLREVATRYELRDISDVGDRVPPRVLELHDTFRHWTHYERMCSVLNKTAGVPFSDPGQVRSPGSAQ